MNWRSSSATAICWRCGDAGMMPLAFFTAGCIQRRNLRRNRWQPTAVRIRAGILSIIGGGIEPLIHIWRPMLPCAALLCASSVTASYASIRQHQHIIPGNRNSRSRSPTVSRTAASRRPILPSTTANSRFFSRRLVITLNFSIRKIRVIHTVLPMPDRP